MIDIFIMTDINPYVKNEWGNIIYIIGSFIMRTRYILYITAIVDLHFIYKQTMDLE